MPKMIVTIMILIRVIPRMSNDDENNDNGKNNNDWNNSHIKDK